MEKPIETWTIKKDNSAVGGQPHEDVWNVWDRGDTVAVSNETANCFVTSYNKDEWRERLEQMIYINLRGEVVKCCTAEGKERSYPSLVDWWQINNTQPAHTHDSTCCRFLGVYDTGEGIVDLYWCGRTAKTEWGSNTFNLTSMLARYGSEGSEYASSNPPFSCADPIGYLKVAQGWYHECLRRAKVSGLIPDSEWEKIVPLYLTVRLAGRNLPKWDNLLPNLSLATYCVVAQNRQHPYRDVHFIDAFSEKEAVEVVQRKVLEMREDADVSVWPFSDISKAERKTLPRFYQTHVGS